MSDEEKRDEAFKAALMLCAELLDGCAARDIGSLPDAREVIEDAQTRARAVVALAQDGKHAIPCRSGVWGCDVIGRHSHKGHL